MALLVCSEFYYALVRAKKARSISQQFSGNGTDMNCGMHVRTLHQMQQRDGWVRDDAFLTDLISRHLAQLITDKKVHYV